MVSVNYVLKGLRSIWVKDAQPSIVSFFDFYLDWRVYRSCEAKGDFEKRKSDQMNIDKMVLIVTRMVWLNVSPFVLFTSVSFYKEAVAHVQTAFPVGFLPDAEVAILLSPDRGDAILGNFPLVARGR